MYRGRKEIGHLFARITTLRQKKIRRVSPTFSQAIFKLDTDLDKGVWYVSYVVIFAFYRRTLDDNRNQEQKTVWPCKQ